MAFVSVHPTKRDQFHFQSDHSVHYDTIKFTFSKLMHKSTLFYCLVLSESQYISFIQLRFSLSLGNLPNSSYRPATSAVNYP